MRKIFLPIAALALAAACGFTIKFDVSRRIPKQQIPAVTPGALGLRLPVGLLLPIPMNLDDSKEFKDEDVDRVESVRLTSLRLALTTGSRERTFDFLDRIQVDVRNRRTGNRLHVAGTNDVPRGVTAFFVPVTRNELFEEVGTNFDLILEVDGRFPQNDAEFAGSAEFDVVAEVL